MDVPLWVYHMVNMYFRVCVRFRFFREIRRRRASSSSSRRAFEVEDTANTETPVPRPMPANLFSIDEVENDDYYYDEIFERSAFVDETVASSNKELAAFDEENNDLPDLMFKGAKY